MKRILVPISFSKSSSQALRHAVTLYKKTSVTLLNMYPVQEYGRKYDFGKKQYALGIREKLKKFYYKHVEAPEIKVTFLAFAGATSQAIDQISSLYDLIVMSRKKHPSKKNGYFSDRKLFITTKSRSPVLIMPSTNTPFSLEESQRIWHIKRRETESAIVSKGLSQLSIKPECLEVKSLRQTSFLSAFWKNIVAYENSHDKQLLKKIDEAYDSRSIDLIIVVDHEPSMFIAFFRSDVLRLFCKYDIPILVFPAK